MLGFDHKKMLDAMFRIKIFYGILVLNLLEANWLYGNYKASLITCISFIWHSIMRPLYFVQYILAYHSCSAYHSTLFQNYFEI